MDGSVLDMDQIENLIKFSPTKDEMDMLKVRECCRFYLRLQYYTTDWLNFRYGQNNFNFYIFIPDQTLSVKF